MKYRNKFLADTIGLFLIYLAMVVAFRNMVDESYIAAIVFPVSMIIFLKNRSCVRYIRKFLEAKLSIKRYRIYTVIAVWLVSIVVMVSITWNMRVELSWDWGRLIKCAATYVKTGVMDDVESFIGYPTKYFARCPNNISWETFLIIYFKIIYFFYPNATYDFYYTASVCMSISFVAVSMLFTYENARMIFKDEVLSFLCFIVTVLSAPFYLYAQFGYTDTICLLLINLSVYLYQLFKTYGMSKIGITAFWALAVISALLFKIKILGFIIIIAISIDIIMTIQLRRKTILLYIVSLVISILCIMFIDDIGDKTVPVTVQEKEIYEMPYTHYIMMGMNSYGGYSDDDVIFTMNAGNYAEKKDANYSELLRRIQEKGVRGTLKHILYVKQKRIWGNSTLAGDDYINRKPKTQSLLRDFLGLKNEKHWAFLIYTWITYFCVLTGTFCNFLLATTRIKCNNTFFIRLAITGIGLFLLVWECNSRYLFAYYSLIIIVGMDGLQSAMNYIRAKRYN